MRRQISIKTKFGWVSVFEDKDRIVKVKFGKTKTYGEIAKKHKLSPRHVGKICSQNNLLLLVPCHRVIRTDGSLGGFTSIGGIKLKKKLLDFEKSW